MVDKLIEQEEEFNFSYQEFIVVNDDLKDHVKVLEEQYIVCLFFVFFISKKYTIL